MLAPVTPGRFTRGEGALLGLGLLVLVALYIWGAHHWLDPVDEGYFVYTSSRILAGDLPYRDFATPYTPGFFYLNALLFKLFGQDLLPPRVMLCLVRGGILLLLYLLGRRIMRPAFAIIPLIVFVGQDPGPTYLEVHPAWLALFFSLTAVWCAARALEGRRAAWWLAAGLAAGGSFAFKQNAGLFTLAALCALPLVEQGQAAGGMAPGWLAACCRLVPALLSRAVGRLGALSFFIVLLLAIDRVMRPHLDVIPATLLVAPLIALAGLVFIRQLAAPGPTAPAEALAGLIWRLALVGLGFVILTLLWLVPLLVALGPARTPLAAFAGSVEQRGYFYPLGDLSLETVLLLPTLALGPLALWRLGRPVPARQRWFEGSVTVAALAGLTVLILARALANYRGPELDPLWLASDLTNNLVLYLPSLAFWPAFVLLARGQVPATQARYLCWYLLAGSLMLLTQYPRMDQVHLLFAGPLLWLPGAYAISRLHRRMLAEAPALGARPIGRSLTFAALLGLPFAAVWPSVNARFDEISGRDAGSLLPGEHRYAALGLPGANVIGNKEQVRQLRLVVDYLQRNSQPGERIFVYPGAPLLYYLSGRPNATRFNHAFPGLLSPEDENEAISALARTPAVFVIWDAENALYWERNGAHQRLTDYIWDHYDVETEVANYVIMGRKDLFEAAEISR